jgi:hypothetical protein
MERNTKSKIYVENLDEGYFGDEAVLPNSIPSISNFVGREDYLADLRESYQKGSRCFVLHGTGGVGKTATNPSKANQPRRFCGRYSRQD